MDADECIRKSIINPEYPEILDWFLFKAGEGKSHFFFIYKNKNNNLCSFVEGKYRESLEDEEEQMVNEEGKIEYVIQ